MQESRLRTSQTGWWLLKLACLVASVLWWLAPNAHAQMDGTSGTTRATAVRHKLTILYTSDIYGRLRDFRCKRPGAKGYMYEPVKRDLSNLLYQVQKIQNKISKDVIRSRVRLDSSKSVTKTAGWVLFNTGDNLGTDLTARFLLEFRGISGVEFMAETFERFGYQLVGIGNHEFSVSREKLREFMEQASLKDVKFAVGNLEDAYAVCLKFNKEARETNKQTKDRTQWTKLKTCVKTPPHALMQYIGNKKRYTIINKGGLKIGVFHLVPKDLQKKVSKRNVRGIAFSDPGTVAGEIATKLRTEEKVDLVVMLSHLEGSSSGGSRVRALLSNLTEESQRIDLVITNELRQGGNPTTLSSFDKNGKGTYIVGAAKYGSMLGRVDIVIEKAGQAHKLVGFQSRSVPLSDKYEPDLRRELIKWERSFCKRWGTPLGAGRIRTEEGMTREQFTKYLLNLMRHMSGAEVAVINDGAIRKGRFFPLKGYITKDDLFRALPFNNSFRLLRIKGSQLNEFLKFDSDEAKGKRLRFIGASSGSVNGRTINDESYYNVIATKYVAENSQGWLSTNLKEKEEYVDFFYSNVNYKKRKTACNQDNITKDKKSGGFLEKLCQPRTRDMMQLHFSTNAFRKLPPTPPPKPDASMASRNTPNASSTKMASAIQQRGPNSIPIPRVYTPRVLASKSKTGRWVAHAGATANAKPPATPPSGSRTVIVHPSNASGKAGSVTPSTQEQPPSSGQQLRRVAQAMPAVKKKPKPPKPFGPNEIPYPGTFLDLRDRVAWTFKTSLSGGTTGIFISPVNISQFYSQHENLSGGFYQKIAVEGAFGLEFQLDTRLHLWKNSINVNYNADISLVFGNDPPAPVFPSIFQESTDQLKVATEYRLRYFSALFQERKWYHTDPFFQVSIDTELSTGPRPDLNFDALVAAGTNEVFHRLNLNGKAGLSFQFTQQLTFKVGFTVQKELAPFVRVRLQNCTPTSSNSCDTNDPTKLSINTDWNLGASVEYEISSWEIFRINKTPVSWTSKAEYKLTFLVGRTQALNIHDLRWENAFSFNILGRLSLSFGFKFFLFQGIFKPVQEVNEFIYGPLAYRIDPFIRLNFQWGTRGQFF